MKTRITVYLLLTCATCFTVFWLVRSNRQWEETKFINRQALLGTAAYTGDLALAKVSIAAGADVNFQGRGQPGNSHLWYAVAWGNEEMARFLLDHGADPNGGKAQSPLVDLCYRTFAHTPSSNLSMAKLLLEHGADPNVHQEEAKEKLTALKGARLSETFRTHVNADLIALLQQYGAKD